LVEDIRTCYLQSTDLKNKTFDNIKILSFKNKRNITEKQLLQLSKNKSCLENFDKYNSLTLSDSPEISEKMKKQISIIIDYKSESNNDATFADSLTEEMTDISKVAGLTKWLKIEYYSHQND
jgi:TolB-like protein